MSRGFHDAQKLSPHRIRGVSFRRQRVSQSESRSNRPFATERPPHLDEIALKEARPLPLQRYEINRLIYDTSRTELHALVIDCIEHVSRWRQLSHAFDKYISMRDSKTFDAVKIEDEPSRTTTDHHLATETRAIFSLWRHRLEILELISQTQFSLLRY